MCYFAQAVAVNLSPVLFGVFHRLYHLDLSLLGVLIAVNFVSQLAVDLLCAPLCRRLGYRASMSIALVFCALGMILLGTLVRIWDRAFVALLIPTVAFSVGGGMLEVVVSPVADAIAPTRSKGVMGLLFSFYSWGQLLVVLLTSIALTLLQDALWYLLPYVWAAVPLGALIALQTCAYPPQEPPSDAKRFLLNRYFVLAMLVMLCAGASEMIVSQWSSLFAETALQLPKLAGDALGACGFALCMGIGRRWIAIKPPRNPDRVLIAAGAMLIVSFAMLSLIPNPYICLMGCSLTGLSVSWMWPITVSRCAGRFPTAGALMFGLLAVSGDVGCSLGPLLSGVWSEFAMQSPILQQLAARTGASVEQLGMRVGVGACAIFPILLLIALILLAVEQRRRPSPRADEPR